MRPFTPLEQDIKGFFTTFIAENDVHVVWNVCISRKYRGHHLAQKMMSMYIKTIVKDGEKVWLATSPDSPSFVAAVTTYARLGFKNSKISTLSPEGHELPETIAFEYTHPSKPPTKEQVSEVIRKTMLLATSM